MQIRKWRAQPHNFSSSFLFHWFEPFCQVVARVCQGASALWFLLSPPTRKIRPFRPCDKIAGYEKLFVPLVIL
jgi:hypothetical protein